MNNYSLRSKKIRESSIMMIDLSHDSDDDEECSSGTLEHGCSTKDTTLVFKTHRSDDACCDSLSTPLLVALQPQGKRKRSLLDKVNVQVADKSASSGDAEDMHGHITQDSSRESGKHYSSKQASMRKKKKLVKLQPEGTTSSIVFNTPSITNNVCPPFDDAEYTSLCERYLTPRTRIEPELPSGMILRRQHRGRIIDATSPLYHKLRVKVDALLKKNNHEEVHRLLCQLRDWELNPRQVPAIFQSEKDEEVVEVFDLTNSRDEPSYNNCIDVDEFITASATTLSTSIPEVVPSSGIKSSTSLIDECAVQCGDKAVKINAHTSLKTHPGRIKLSKTTFHDWLAKKKVSWRKRRKKCQREQTSIALLWSPSSLQKASLRIKTTQFPVIEPFKQTLPESVVKRGTTYPIRKMSLIELSATRKMSLVELSATTMNEMRLVVPQITSSRSCDIPAWDLHPSSPLTCNNSSVVAIVTPDGKKDTGDTGSSIQNDMVKNRQRTAKRRLYEDQKVSHRIQSSTQFYTFKIADFGFPSPIKTIKSYGASSRDSHTRLHRIERRERLHEHVSPWHNFNFSIIPQLRIAAPSQINLSKSSAASLHKEWNEQVTKRKKGEWEPSGHMTGRWKCPSWVDVKAKGVSAGGDDLVRDCRKQKSLGCRKTLLPVMDGIMKTYSENVLVRPLGSSLTSFHATSLQDVLFPNYVKPTITLLRHAHAAVSSLLPDGDCEEWEVVELARSYYNYWRPTKTKVILLAESHAFTSKDRALCGPGLDKDLLQDAYFGPRGFISLVYCLSYGENESLAAKLNDESNKGTPQFWTLLAACARGVEHIAVACTQNSSSSPFASDLLKAGNLSVQERLRAKLAVLEDLRRRGIWLIDTSVFGWYISQPQTYTRSKVSNEVHRKQKSRPPSYLKAPSLVLSWELFTKHVVREVADEGHLKFLVPIGMEVEGAITRKRMEDAIHSGNSDGAQVADTFPAPNAWIPGGYGPFHAKLAALVDEAAPRVANSVR